jgi:4'-phosphopantetheinyl transferase
MEVHWLEQADADVPTGNDWLGAAEALRLGDMRFAKRRADWRLGRWTAKRALSIYGNRPSDSASLAAIEILPAASGAPDVFVANQPAAVTISISHRAHVAFCAVAAPVVALGCDLEIIEPRSDAFAADYFTAQEQHLLRRGSPEDRWRLLALLWSGKESVLKALRLGLRVDTRSVCIDPTDALLPNPQTWLPLQAHYENRIFHGWWQQTDHLVRTMVAVPQPSKRPCNLQTGLRIPALRATQHA